MKGAWMLKLTCSQPWYSASYPMGTRASFPGGKATRLWSWPLTSI